MSCFGVKIGKKVFYPEPSVSKLSHENMIPRIFKQKHERLKFHPWIKRFYPWIKFLYVRFYPWIKSLYPWIKSLYPWIKSIDKDNG